MSIGLTEVVTAATVQLGLQEEVQRLEGILKDYKEKLRFQSQQVLPNLMAEVGIDSLTLPNGFKVSIKDEIYAKIPEDSADKAFSWLREHDLDGIIKTNVFVDFGKGEDEKAQKTLDILHAAGIPALSKSTIHPMTLKAFLKEQVFNGKDIPLDLFGAEVVKTTIIKQ